MSTDKRITDEQGRIVGTWDRFDNMNDVTLAYNLGSLTDEELKLVPQEYTDRWEKWRSDQASNPYWTNPTHC